MSVLFLMLVVGMLVFLNKNLSLLRKFYSKRHEQFHTAILWCTSVPIITCMILAARLLVEWALRPSIEKLVHEVFNGTGDTGIMIYFTLTNGLIDCLA